MRDREIGYIKDRMNSQIQYFQDEIKYLYSLISGIKTDNRDETELKKIQALYDQLKYENNEANRYYLEKAISQAEQDFNERKQIEKIQEQIENYKEQIHVVKENAQTEIEQVKATADARIKALRAEEEAEIGALRAIMAQREQAHQKAVKNMEASEKNYEKSAENIKNISEKTIQNINDNVEEGQQKNLTILDNFQAKYQSAGNVLGNAFANGFLSHIHFLEQRIEVLGHRLENLIHSSAGLRYFPGVQHVNHHVNSLGGITQNFYANEITPYEARKMAEDIINKVF